MFRSLVRGYSVASGCHNRVAQEEFGLVLRTQADCLLRNADSEIQAAELMWKMDELLSALAIREKVILE